MPRNCWKGNIACCCCKCCCRFISSRAVGETKGKVDARRWADNALSWCCAWAACAWAWVWAWASAPDGTTAADETGGDIGFVIDETPVDELALVIGDARFWSFSAVNDSSTLSMFPLWAAKENVLLDSNEKMTYFLGKWRAFEAADSWTACVTRPAADGRGRLLYWPPHPTDLNGAVSHLKKWELKSSCVVYVLRHLQFSRATPLWRSRLHFEVNLYSMKIMLIFDRI